MSTSEKSTVSASPGHGTGPDGTLVTRAAAEYLIASMQAERALTAGRQAPAFRLPDQERVEVSSDTLLRSGPLLVTFFAGTWCPACRLDLQALEAIRPTVREHGATLLSVSQQTVAENRKARETAGLGFPLLSDRGGRMAALFGVRWRVPEFLRGLYRDGGVDLPALNGEQSWTLPIPARFVVDKAGVIVYSEINPDLGRRSDPRDVLPVLDNLRRLRAAFRERG